MNYDDDRYTGRTGSDQYYRPRRTAAGDSAGSDDTYQTRRYTRPAAQSGLEYDDRARDYTPRQGDYRRTAEYTQSQGSATQSAPQRRTQTTGGTTVNNRRTITSGSTGSTQRRSANYDDDYTETYSDARTTASNANRRPATANRGGNVQQRQNTAPVRRSTAAERGRVTDFDDDFDDEPLNSSSSRAASREYDDYDESPRRERRGTVTRINTGRLAVIATLAIALAVLIPVSIANGWFTRNFSGNDQILNISSTDTPFEDVFANTATDQPQQQGEDGGQTTEGVITELATAIPTIAVLDTVTEAPATVTQAPAAGATEVPPTGPFVSAGRTLDPTKKAIALTFDDGPSKYSSEIMDILEQYGGRGTFFVVGERLDEWADTLKREHDDGHQVGSHTYSHENLRNISVDEIIKQVEDTEALITKYTGEPCTILRPPYGAINETVKATVKYPMIKWSIDSRDWDSKNADSVYQVVMESVVDGDIILMHDMYESTVEAVRRLVPELVNQGYQLCTIDELFRLKRVSLHPGSAWLSAKGTPNY